MAKTIEVKVPDIGGYDDVPVIEVLVSPGDVVAVDQGLATLESDKATMEVPSSAAGTVREVRIKVGDKVSVTVTDSDEYDLFAVPAKLAAEADTPIVATV